MTDPITPPPPAPTTGSLFDIFQVTDFSRSQVGSRGAVIAVIQGLKSQGKDATTIHHKLRGKGVET